MRIPDLIKAGPAIILWLLAGMAFSAPQATGGQSTCAQEVAEIQAYCKKIDRFMKANPNGMRVFASSSLYAKGGANGWRELTTEGAPRREDLRDDAAENASVWLSQGKIVAASFCQRESHDWVQLAMYYYRDDGTLARISAQLDVLYAETSFVREQFYDHKGVMIAGSTKSCSLKTSRTRKSPIPFMPEPLVVYPTTDRLPFYQALKKEIRNAKFEMRNLYSILTEQSDWRM